MTSTGGSEISKDETVQAGPSEGNTPAAADDYPQEEPDPDETRDKATGTKRMLSTGDPDYTHLPHAKRMREMQQRAQDELNQRVIKVVDKEVHKAIIEKEAEMEEIDARILKLQQCLHTLRFCVSLNYYNINKSEPQTREKRDRKLSGLHPTIQHHLDKAPITPLKTSENLSASRTSKHTMCGPNTDQKGKVSMKSESNAIPLDGAPEGPTTIQTDNTRTSAPHCSSKSTSLPPPHSQNSDETSDKPQSSAASETQCSRPPSPKYLPPLPPDNAATISQGRQHRLQNKRRLIVGNTYQYLAPLAEEEQTDSFRYKWQVYVRAPPNNPDTATFLQSVTFILDNSYSPHHVITIKQPPFVLSRRGWGEFNVKLVLRFIDQRNKSVQLLHPLVLSRPNDALALTGLWRLGQENWYDLWVYLPNPETNSNTNKVKEEDSCPATLTQELQKGVISSQVEGNITVDHIPILDKGIPSEYPSKEESIKRDDVSVKRECNSMSGCLTTQSEKKAAPKSLLNETGGENQEKSTKEESKGVSRKESVVNGKSCTVYVRQADGSLKPYLIPSHLYAMAMQLAQNNTKQNNLTAEKRGNNLPQEATFPQGVVQKSADGVSEGNELQLKDTPKHVTLKLAIQQSTSCPSSSVAGVTLKGLSEAGNSQSTMKVVKAATDTGTTTCPQHLLLQIGLKEKKLALVQKQHSSKPLKQASSSDSLQLTRVQVPSQQTSSQESFTAVKTVNKAPVIRLPKIIDQNSTSGNVKYISNNGQLLTTERLKVLGLQVYTDQEKCGSVTKNLVASNTITAATTTTSTINTTVTSVSNTGSLLIQGGRMMDGANTLHLITSQDKTAVKQLTEHNMHIKKASNIPAQSLVDSNRGKLVVLGTSSGLVKIVPNRVKIEANNETKPKKGTNPPIFLRTLSRASSSTDCYNEKTLIDVDTKEQPQEDIEKWYSSHWEDYLNRVCKVCKTSISSTLCVSLWLKVLPLVQPSQMPPSPFSFCRATSHHQFLSWPLAKQRACEFHRAREVVWWLEECHVKEWERWTVPRVVAWARAHAHTPVAHRPVLCTDKLQPLVLTPASGKSLSDLGDLQELEQHMPHSNTTCTADSPEVDVVGLDNEEEAPQRYSKRVPGSPLKRQLSYLHWEDGDMSSGCEWVGQLTSQLMFSMHSEEVADGFMADAARGTLWKAVLSLMEDLLRATHSQAWNEATHVPPDAITVPHVLAALTTSRPEFDIFTDHGLGTPNEPI